MASKVVTTVYSSSNSNDDEEEEDNISDEDKNQTEIILYEYIDSRSHQDNELTHEQYSLMHRAASNCIRDKGRQDQGDCAERVAEILRRYGDEFQTILDNDENLQLIQSEVIVDTDSGQPSIDTIASHIAIVVNNVFNVDVNGIARSINVGRIASVFYYCYSLCKKVIQVVFANHTLVEFLVSISGLLIASLVRVHFFSWLKEQGGWGRGIVNLFTSQSNSLISRNVLLFGSVLLFALWSYRVYRGFK